MVLQWKLRDIREAVPMQDRKITALKDEHLVIGYHGWAFAQWGVFQIDVCPNDRQYQNGTRLYKVWLHCKEASNGGLITLTKIRGDLGMALQAAENFLFSAQYDMPADPMKENYQKRRLDLLMTEAPNFAKERLDTILTNRIKRNDMNEQDELLFVEYLFDKYEKSGFATTYQCFGSDETKKFEGMSFKVIGRCEYGEQPLRHLPMWHIEIEDGTIFDALPEEICTFERENVTWFTNEQYKLHVNNAIKILQEAGYTLMIKIWRDGNDRANGISDGFYLSSIVAMFKDPQNPAEELVAYMADHFDHYGCAELRVLDGEYETCLYHLSNTDQYLTNDYFCMIEEIKRSKAWITPLKAVDIEWDIDDEDADEDNLNLPTEIEIPTCMTDGDEISDYLSNQTGFCHKGFRLVDAEGNEVDIDA